MEAVMGAGFWAPGDAIVGWCWCPGQPGVVREVTLLADGQVIGGTLANQLAEGIRANGPPHEMFGFMIPVGTEQRARHHRFDLLESRRGVCFARLIGEGKDEQAAGLLRRAEAVAKQAALITALEAPVATAAEGFGLAGRGLLGRRPGLVRLPVVERPELSLIVLGGNVLRLVESLRQLAVLVADRPVEVLLVPCLSDAEASVLAGCVRGARLLHHGSAVEALNLARGDELVVIDGEGADWPAALAMFEEPRAPAEGAVRLIINRRDWLCWAADFDPGDDPALFAWAADQERRANFSIAAM